MQLRSEYSTCLSSIIASLEYDLTQVEVMRNAVYMAVSYSHCCLVQVNI